MSNIRVARLATVFIASALVLAGCHGDTGNAPAEAAAGYPRAVDNCGTRVSVPAPPRRAVALNQGSAEIMLALGLGDRMVGTATWTDPVLPSLAEDNARVPRLAENMPSFESVLEVEPDFVAASFVSTLGKGGVATREQFAELGVPNYVAPADCQKDNSGGGDGSRDDPLTMDTIYTEIRDLARIFDVQQRGERLITELRERMRKAAENTDTSRVTVLYWFANSDAPYLAGCCGAPGIMTRALDARNVFADTHEEWPQINWEAIADRDPDVLVLGDLTRRSETAETAEQKIAHLESHPVASQLAAVRQKRYVRLSGQAMNPTMRTVDGTEKLAEALREFGLTG
ncbi:iron complex transport system substrate-binding protein [Tamaricihabitans halophyticus]|uniref:Iron complex transport system substrate-binding protein n=1 Tax=Tamaricihabitans halophyticus TaxID=1262583 RepID=A0A4V2STA7_9PSEU|nr:ABC transporter substrate-binding protein [Tamaricihabitans halophyticus]TCP50016.1 iron complex transport system substrate-binding protein [Tamaricihabitans halophyticus]